MPDNPLVILVSVVLQSVVLAGLVVGLYWAGVFVARWFGRKASYSLRPLGFRRPRGGFLVGIGLGLSVGIGAFLMSVIVGALSTVTLQYFGYSAENLAQEPLMRALGGWIRTNPVLAIPATYLVVALVGPAAEELVFRGAIFNGLYRLGRSFLKTPKANPDHNTDWLPFIAAALLSSAFFAALHFSPVIIPAIFILAVALCALYRYTGSLAPTIAAHATFNSVTVTILVIVSLVQG